MLSLARGTSQVWGEVMQLCITLSRRIIWKKLYLKRGYHFVLLALCHSPRYLLLLSLSGKSNGLHAVCLHSVHIMLLTVLLLSRGTSIYRHCTGMMTWQRRSMMLQLLKMLMRDALKHIGAADGAAHACCCSRQAPQPQPQQRSSFIADDERRTYLLVAYLQRTVWC